MHITVYPRWLMVRNAGKYRGEPAGVRVGWRLVEPVQDGRDRDRLLKDRLLSGFLFLEWLGQLDIVIFGREYPLSLLVVDILERIRMVRGRPAQGKEGVAARLWRVGKQQMEWMARRRVTSCRIASKRVYPRCLLGQRLVIERMDRR